MRMLETVQRILISILLFGAMLICACNELQKPRVEPFYGRIETPKKQEFRWSNGQSPKTLDPAFAFGSPETDLIRSLFEGLTDLDSKTLQTIPAVALKWSSTPDFRVWTFNLRRDARWSNGKTVTARDFVSSWKRIVKLGESVPHHKLFSNIAGVHKLTAKNSAEPASEENFPTEIFPEVEPGVSQFTNGNTNTVTNQNKVVINGKTKIETTPGLKEISSENVFGAKALDNFTLEVTLTEPDKDFSALVAHTVFRPVFDNGKGLGAPENASNIISNGAFRFFSYGVDGITLDRADFYWNAPNVQLERVRFVPTENAEKALEAYRAGEIDVITNAHFEPLALKLLAPYKDFRQTTYNALNFYEFNLEKPIFKDRRVREALAIALERERLTNDEMDGASEPAKDFLPNSSAPRTRETEFNEDVANAQKLLADAGFPKGEGFPKIRLLVNQNDLQKRVANSVKKMWFKNLGIDVEIVLKRKDEYNEARLKGDFEIIRRGIVLPTMDESASLAAIFEPQHFDIELENEIENTDVSKPNLNSNQNSSGENQNANSNTNSHTNANLASNSNINVNSQNKSEENGELKIAKVAQDTEVKESMPIVNEAQAMSDLSAIPLYFPKSYSLVKPYVEGFETNMLDAPSLKNVKINNDWQPAKN